MKQKQKPPEGQRRRAPLCPGDRVRISDELRAMRARGEEESARRRWSPGLRRWIPMLAAAAAFLVALTPAAAITVVSQSANTDVFLGATMTESEYQNPLVGSEMLRGYRILEWRDADYVPAQANPYLDWTGPAGLSGNASEVWLLNNGDWLSTATTVPSQVVSIHLPGDMNDGLAKVMVDGIEVARLNMNTPNTPDRALVIVKNLAHSTHAIRVEDIDLVNDDVHCFGAAALQVVHTKWEQPPTPGEPTNVFYGWNELSVHEGPQIAADDWRCNSALPVTGIRWWGSYLGWRQSTPPTQLPASYHFAIWTDIPTPNPEGFSHPGTVVWEFDATAPAPQFVGWDYDPITQTYEATFKYEITIDSAHWFHQPAGDNIHWLSISAFYPSGSVPNGWGWKTRPREPNSTAPDDAVVIWTPTGGHAGEAYGSGAPLYFPDPANSFDLAFELISAAEDWMVKWNQPPQFNPASPFPNCFWGWDERSTRGFVQLVADDWKCNDPNPVKRIRWWGSYYNWDQPAPPSTAPTAFLLTIWTDVPVPNPLGFSHPGTVLWTRTYPRTQLQEHYVGCDYCTNLTQLESAFEYVIDLPAGSEFSQTQGTVYWLSVAAIYSGAVPTNWWGWKTREHYYGDDAVRINAPLVPVMGSPFASGSPVQYPTGVSWDAAFQLSVYAQSAPVTKWSQPPASWVPPDAFNGWNEVSVYGGPQLVADDWVCNDSEAVSDVHWWGSFLGWGERTPPPDAPNSFNITIWTDVPAGGGTQPWSHPGVVIHQFECSNFTWQFAGWDFDPRDPNAAPEACFRFDQFIDQANWFVQEPGNHVYWISIAANYGGMLPQHLWGWKTTPRLDSLDPDDAVVITDPLAPLVGMPFVGGAPLFWPDEAHSWNAAFVLTSSPLPPTDDFGDAPDPPYPTLNASNGARHGVAAGLKLGALEDAESDGQPNATATGDDVSGLADEDGVVFVTNPLIPGQPANIIVTLGTPIIGAFLSAWVDFGGDGSWATPGDPIFVAQPLAFGPNPLTFLVPINAKPGTTYARFRLHTNPGGVPFTGAIPYGEVEDYTVRIAADFGDAPDPPYPTLLASNGAYHTPVPGIMLGNKLDAEVDGQPNANATGDDLANLADEDGVVFNTPLIPGQNAVMTVLVTGPPTGLFLSAYIDFNADGSWLTPGDSLFAAPYPVIAGPNVVNFLVPATATPNVKTFARIRLHTMPAVLPPTGAAANGEVEDYQVQIAPVPKWSQLPHPSGQGFDGPSDVWWNGPAAGTKWEQGPDVTQTALHAHDGPPGTQLILANDWWCQGGVVTDLHWWGTIEQPSPANNQWGFLLSIHANNAGPCLPLDPPLWTANVPLAQIGVSNTGLVNSLGETIYLYKYILPTPFGQQAGQRYWVNISSISINPVTPTKWKWQLGSPPVVLCPGATKQTPSPGTWGPIIIGSTEPAFRITSSGTADPINRVVADDFVSDGRPIIGVRWWGSYLDARYAPGAGTDPLHVLDGWLISFHHALPNRVCPPDGLAGDNPTVLGVYFAPPSAVTITPVGYSDCFNHAVYEYVVDLAQCCPLCFEVDPRDGSMPALADRFAEVQRSHYWLDIQAVTGAVWTPSTIGGCSMQATGHLPPENGQHFWGWHTSPGPTNQNLCGGMLEACAGRITNFLYQPPGCWQYGNWSKQPWLCPAPVPSPVQMAFELLTDRSPQNLTPWIVQQPVSLAVCEGDPARFEVWACGSSVLNYQWYKVVLPPPNLPVGGNSPILTINPTQLSDAGNYYVVISNAFGSVTSSQATLTVWDRGSGDADFNGVVNGEDIQEFVGVLIGTDTTPQRVCVCDMNGSGSVTPADVPQFVNKLLGL